MNVSAELTGLEGNTPYHYRLVARNAAGVTYGLDGTLLTERAEWVVADMPQPPNSGLGEEAFDVSCLPSEKCVSVGSNWSLDLHASATLAEWWDGSAWEPMTTPNPPGLEEGWEYQRYATLRSVSCVPEGSPKGACIAVGYYKGTIRTGQTGGRALERDQLVDDGTRHAGRLGSGGPAGCVLHRPQRLQGSRRLRQQCRCGGSDGRAVGRDRMDDRSDSEPLGREGNAPVRDLMSVGEQLCCGRLRRNGHQRRRDVAQSIGTAPNGRKTKRPTPAKGSSPSCGTSPAPRPPHVLLSARTRRDPPSSRLPSTGTARAGA